MNHLVARLETAIEAAPYFDRGSSIPDIDSSGAVIPSAFESPNDLGDYDPFILNSDYKEPANGVLVTSGEYPALFEALAETILRVSGVRPIVDSDSIIYHERQHGTVFEALGAPEVRYGIKFGKIHRTYGFSLSATPFTTALDVRTFKLGFAAIFAAPIDPSESDLAVVANLGYGPLEVATKVQQHNYFGRQPYIPDPAWASSRVKRDLKR